VCLLSVCPLCVFANALLPRSLTCIGFPVGDLATVITTGNKWNVVVALDVWCKGGIRVVGGGRGRRVGKVWRRDVVIVAALVWM